MKKGMKILIVVIVAILVIALPLISNYNSLVSLNQSADNSFANIDTQLQRRSDLIPNLVSTVKGYATQEKDIFTEIADARTKLAGAGNVSDKADADSELSSSLSRLLVIVEAYPDLKSNQNFRDLSIQLEGTENRISIAREDYNASVTEYNTKRRKFPSNLTASMFGFEEKDLYKASEGAKELPTVDFTTKNE